MDELEIAEMAITDQIEDKSQAKKVLLTLLAINIFQKKFEDLEDEWKLIVQKAYNYLRQQGLADPDQILNDFDFFGI